MPVRITSLEARDIRFPTSRSLDGSDAMHPSPDYSCAYVVLAHRLGRRARGPRPDLHERARHRGRRRCGARARAPRRRADARGDHRRHARLLAQPHLGRPASLARAREGRHPPRHRRRRQRRLGPVGEERGQAAVPAARRPRAGADRRRDRLPLHRGRAAAGRGARPPAADAHRPRRAAGRDRALGLSGLHDLGRLARLRRREDRDARARGGRGRLRPREDEGRPRPRLAMRGAPS